MALCNTWRVKLAHVHALVHAVNSFPANTPRRWQLVSQLLSFVNGGESAMLEVGLTCTVAGDCEGRKHCMREFDGSEGHCKELYSVIEQGNAEIFEQRRILDDALLSDGSKSGFKPLVLLPGRMECCGKKVVVRNRPAFPLVFTTKGTLVAAAYSATCNECKALIHHSSWSPKGEERVEHFFDPSHSPYISTSSQTVFEVKLFEQVTQQMVHAGVTFESQALVYNSCFGMHDEECLGTLKSFSRVRNASSLSWKLNEKRLEDGWFMYNVILYHQSAGCLETQDLRCDLNKGKRRDIDDLCEQVNLHRSLKSPRWVSHQCTLKGCSEGFAVVDGNEKLNRTVCAAPRSKVCLPNQHICMTTLCCRSPVTGGKHVQASKFCALHVGVDNSGTSSSSQGTQSSSTALQIADAPNPHTPNPILKRDKVGEVPENDDESVLVGCRKEKGVTKFYDRTAGVLALVRPCGVIVNTTEMYTCESPTQVYLFLVMTFGHGDDIKRLRYLGYDRACDLHPFLCNVESRGGFFAKWLNRNVCFFVDSFHVAKHTEPCCMPPENPKCRYHPSLPHLSEIHGVNTECAEQAFRWLNKLKSSLKQMHQHRFNFFLQTIIHHRNMYIEQQLRERNYLN